MTKIIGKYFNSDKLTLRHILQQTERFLSYGRFITQIGCLAWTTSKCETPRIHKQFIAGRWYFWLLWKLLGLLKWIWLWELIPCVHMLRFLGIIIYIHTNTHSVNRLQSLNYRKIMFSNLLTIMLLANRLWVFVGCLGLLTTIYRFLF